MDTDSEKLTALVSIVMVTYNRAAYIRHAIDSALGQTYSAWELIIIDDGSTDETSAIVATYKDPRIRYVLLTQNRGVHAARSRGIAESQGKYIAVLDSDDLWNDQDKLRAQVAFLETHPEHGLVGTFINTIDANGAHIAQNTYSTDDSSIRASILLRNQFAHSSVLMRASTVREVGGYRKVLLGEDLDLFLRLGNQAKFSNIPAYMTSYRIHNDGLSRNGKKMARAVLGFVWKYRAHYPNFLRAYAKSILVLMVGRLLDTRTIRR